MDRPDIDGIIRRVIDDGPGYDGDRPVPAEWFTSDDATFIAVCLEDRALLLDYAETLERGIETQAATIRGLEAERESLRVSLLSAAATFRGYEAFTGLSLVETIEGIARRLAAGGEP